MCVLTAQRVIDSGLTISTAESCTGGMVAHKFTCVSGASKSYKGGIVAYTDYIKENLLGVSQDYIRKYTAVSKEVAEEMAINSLLLFNSDISIATTGYAAPSYNGDQYAYIAVAYKCKGNNSYTKIECCIEKIKLKYPKSKHRFVEYITGDAYHLLGVVLNILDGNEDCGNG